MQLHLNYYTAHISYPDAVLNIKEKMGWIKNLFHHTLHSLRFIELTNNFVYWNNYSLQLLLTAINRIGCKLHSNSARWCQIHSKEISSTLWLFSTLYVFGCSFSLLRIKCTLKFPQLSLVNKSALLYSVTFKYIRDVPIDNVIPNEPILPLKAVPWKTYNPAPPCYFVLDNLMPKM